jgi:hypothetical protein
LPKWVRFNYNVVKEPKDFAMNFIDMLKMRRSVYALDKQLPVSKEQVLDIIKDSMQYVPDAFDMKSQRLLVLLGEEHEDFWENVDALIMQKTGGKIPDEKIEAFKAGYGTILYFYDGGTVCEYKKNFSLYADNFDNWATQSNAMLQFAIWTAFASVGVGANLQHYNPIIDDMVHKIFNLPENWVLIAQMTFGGIAVKPEEKQSDEPEQRIKFME